MWWVVVKVGQCGSALGVNAQSTTGRSRGESRRVKIRETHMEISATYPKTYIQHVFKMTIYIANSETYVGALFEGQKMTHKILQKENRAKVGSRYAIYLFKTVLFEESFEA